jgi:hypothetical protein
VNRTILSAVTILLCIHSFAQKIQFSNNTNTWSVKDSTNACCLIIPTAYTTAYYDSKVSLNGYVYEHLADPQGSCLIRQEGGRVYAIGAEDSIERVMYDFNLGVNDTLKIVYPEDAYITWVSSIDSTMLYGTWYKVWHFDGMDYGRDSVRQITYNVIEGIGCTNGPSYPLSPYSLYTYSEQLLCFTNDMGFSSGFSSPVASYGYQYNESFDNQSSCARFVTNPILTLGVSTGVQATNASVVPNPTDENSKIMLPYTITSGTLYIINELGQQVINVSFQDKAELLIGNKITAPGLYIYRATDIQNGKVFSGKFIYR